MKSLQELYNEVMADEDLRRQYFDAKKTESRSSLPESMAATQRKKNMKLFVLSKTAKMRPFPLTSWRALRGVPVVFGIAHGDVSRILERLICYVYRKMR